LQVAIDETDKKINEEGMTKASYQHMLERMKKDFIATKIKSSEMEGSLKNKASILDIEQGKQRKTKEERLQSKAIFDSLMKNIEKEQRDRQERILELQKCIKNKEESVQRRIERQRRNQEIAEAAANENKDSSELRMREDLYIQKVYNIFIKNKMKQEMAHSQQIDDAFKAIKTAVVVNDVQEMVRKFLTREQTYSSLLVAVSESERKIDKVKKDNEELRARLHELQIDSDANAQKDDKGQQGPFDEEIVEMNKKLSDQKYHQGLLNEKFKKINIVNDQISGWAKRVYTKFGALVDDPVFHQEPNDITKIFQAMDAISVKELRAMKEKRKNQEDDEEKGLEYGDVFNDFATEDFISKNIRVRPISGITHGDETRDGR
jgi:outer membrane murein-binding lipoprotein Lpp